MEQAPKTVHIVGGLTEEYDGDSHLYESAARSMFTIAHEQITDMNVQLHITDRSGGNEGIRTQEDLRELARQLVGNLSTKLVVWMPDQDATDRTAHLLRNTEQGNRGPRKDIFSVMGSFTKGLSPDHQYTEALRRVKQTSSNLAVAFDESSRHGMVVGPEEASYDDTNNLNTLMTSALDIAELRSHLTFTRSTVISGEPVDWNSSLVYPSLREVVNYCVDHDAYKPFLGVTAGHFAVKIGENEFLTSRRKTDFRKLGEIGLVRVVTDGPDNVIAFGSKPSVGGQSQRIVFENHQDENCIVHFHCPTVAGSEVPVVSQRAFECGSHECGMNTSDGLAEMEEGIKAVYLDNHGPNIVFNDGVDPLRVATFIDGNFDLHKKTGGYQLRTR